MEDKTIGLTEFNKSLRDGIFLLRDTIFIPGETIERWRDDCLRMLLEDRTGRLAEFNFDSCDEIELYREIKAGAKLKLYNFNWTPISRYDLQYPGKHFEYCYGEIGRFTNVNFIPTVCEKPTAIQLHSKEMTKIYFGRMKLKYTGKKEVHEPDDDIYRHLLQFQTSDLQKVTIGSYMGRTYLPGSLVTGKVYLIKDAMQNRTAYSGDFFTSNATTFEIQGENGPGMRKRRRVSTSESDWSSSPKSLKRETDPNLVLIVEGKKFNVDSELLISESKVFEDFFNLDLIEKDKKEYELKDIGADDFEQFLLAMANQEKYLGDEQKIMTLIKTCEHFDAVEVMREILVNEDNFNQFSIENYDKLLELARDYEMDRLQESLEEGLMEKFTGKEEDIMALALKFKLVDLLVSKIEDYDKLLILARDHGIDELKEKVEEVLMEKFKGEEDLMSLAIKFKLDDLLKMIENNYLIYWDADECIKTVKALIGIYRTENSEYSQKRLKNFEKRYSDRIAGNESINPLGDYDADISTHLVFASSCKLETVMGELENILGERMENSSSFGPDLCLSLAVEYEMNNTLDFIERDYLEFGCNKQTARILLHIYRMEESEYSLNRIKDFENAYIQKVSGIADPDFNEEMLSHVKFVKQCRLQNVQKTIGKILIDVLEKRKVDGKIKRNVIKKAQEFARYYSKLEVFLSKYLMNYFTTNNSISKIEYGMRRIEDSNKFYFPTFRKLLAETFTGRPFTDPLFTENKKGFDNLSDEAKVFLFDCMRNTVEEQV